MAINYAALEEVLNKEFMGPVSDLIARSNPLLSMIQKKGVATDKIRIRLRTASDHAAGPIADGADVSFAGTEGTTYDAGELTWSTYIAKVQVNKRLLAEVAAQPGGIGQLLAEEIKIAAQDLSDRIAADIFKGTISNGLVGLKTIFSASNTYAGIDRSTVSAWRAIVKDLTIDGTPDTTDDISTDHLYAAEKAFFEANKYGFSERPNNFIGFTSAGILNKYKKMFQTLDVGALSSAHWLNTNVTNNLGLNGVSWMGVPLVRTTNIDVTGDLDASGRLYFLDMSKLMLASLTPADPSARATQSILGINAAPSIDGITARIEVLANTGESVKIYVKTYLQLVTDDPRGLGVVLTNIAE